MKYKYSIYLLNINIYCKYISYIRILIVYFFALYLLTIHIDLVEILLKILILDTHTHTVREGKS